MILENDEFLVDYKKNNVLLEECSLTFVEYRYDQRQVKNELKFFKFKNDLTKHHLAKVERMKEWHQIKLEG